MREGISFGMSHCCACSQVCYHIGPIQLCEEHRERRLIESYESKVQDLARETLRNSELRAELTTLHARHQDALEWLREFKAEGVYEFTPETAPEGFLQQTIKDLLNDLLAVLEGENE